MAQKPSIPKGTRDFSPEEVVKRNYIFDVIKATFVNFGFQPIETPSFENSETLMGKYGEEGDRLIFKILNSGDFLKTFNVSLMESIKTVLFNFQLYLKESDDNSIVKIGYFKDNFLKVYPKILQSKNEIKFEQGKTQFESLTRDIWFFIEKIIIEKSDGIQKLKTADNERLTVLTIIIFGDFYFNLASKYINNYVSEKALRYDLTVPFARYVVQRQNEITFPFKRYQIQPVWRADRPQKGRFREFYQCDADVVGSKSLWQEVELVQLYDTVFSDLKLTGVVIKINNRKILSGIAEVIGAEDKIIDFTVALDKLEKIGKEKVKDEMRIKGISEAAIAKVEPLFNVTGTTSEKLQTLKTLLASSEVGQQGIEEIEFIVNNISALGLKTTTLEIDVTLARGLNYYTGAIFEVAAPSEVKMGSIGGGGRYDDLTGIFGLKDMSGVGISFGLDRIYMVLEELGLFPETVSVNTKALFVNFGNKEALYAMKAISALRNEGIAVELYPDETKMGKQMGYADKRGIPFVILAGDTEITSGTYTLKDMSSGEQDTVSLQGLIGKLS